MHAVDSIAGFKYREPKEMVKITKEGEWYKNLNAKTTKKCDFMYEVEWQGGFKNGDIGVAWEKELQHEHPSIGVDVRAAGTTTGGTQAREGQAKKGGCSC